MQVLITPACLATRAVWFYLTLLLILALALVPEVAASEGAEVSQTGEDLEADVVADPVDVGPDLTVVDLPGEGDVAAQPEEPEEPPELTEAEKAEKLLQDSLTALATLMELRERLQTDIAEVTAELTAAETDVARADFTAQIESLKTDLDSTEANISEVATGADIASLGEVEQQTFDFQQELFSLLEPLMKEAKGLTSHVRAKTVQRDKISYYQERIPIAQAAVLNLEHLIENSDRGVLRSNLLEMRSEWKDQLTFMSSQLSTAQFQLEKLESSEVSLTEASQSYFKTFVRTRGLYLGQALLTILGILLLGRLVHRGLERFVPGYRAQLRSFRIRLFDLLFRIGVVLAAILGPMVVFYLAEDWMLFSIGLLLLLGIGLTLRKAIPRFWSQIQLFLNIGSVREGERIEIDGLPWRVKQINFYSTLENPTADLELRVKIDELVDLRSRPSTSSEPWFPCQKGDWLLFPDDRRGKVIGISPELTQVVERGGAHRTFATVDFLTQKALNLSTNFRIKETLGISYAHIEIATSEVLEKLASFINERVMEEGYADALLNLRVEFENASDSSLDVVVIADFSGQLADIYNRLRRSIQRWCVDAAATHNWEIPFPQVTVHSGS